MVAARALAAPVGELAAAIARQDEKLSARACPGIGPQKAKNIVAQLQAKVAKFALARARRRAPEPAARRPRPTTRGCASMVWEVLVKQLGHRPERGGRSSSTDALAPPARRRRRPRSCSTRSTAAAGGG